MAAIHVLVDGGAALPSGAAASYDLTQVAHHIQVGATRFHAGTAEPADLNAALADPRMAVLPAETAELVEGYAAVAAMGVALLSLHAPTDLGGLADRAAAAAAAAGLPSERIAIRGLPLLGPGLGMVALHAAEVAQEAMPLVELAEDIVGLTAAMRSETVAMDPERLRAKAAERGWSLRDPAAEAAEAAEEASGDGRSDATDTAETESKAAPREQPAEGPICFRFDTADDGSTGLVIVDRCPDLNTAMRQLAGRILADGRGRTVHLAAASTGAEAEVAALATFLDAQLGLAEAWLAPADPLTAWLCGAGSFTVAWYAEG